MGDPMAVERVGSKGLAVAAVLAALVLASAAWQRLRQLDFSACRQHLADGDLEHDERLALLARLCATADGSRPAEAMAAALAEVAREDLPAFYRRRGCAAGELPLRPADVATFDAATCDTASFGDDVLHRLLLAFCAEARGEGDSAKARYAEVQQSARLYRMAAAGELCAQGLSRLR